MKKLIILHQTYVDAKEDKLNKGEAEVARQKIFEQSVKTFKEQMKELLDVKFFKILKEVYAEDAVLVEYEEVLDERMWKAFRAADIINVVDSIVPSDI
jgi:formyltetrahydrofolate hydrolase